MSLPAACIRRSLSRPFCSFSFGCAKIKPADLTKERFGHKHWKDTFRLGCYQQISLTNGPHIIPYSARPDLDLMEQYVHLGMVCADLFLSSTNLDLSASYRACRTSVPTSEVLRSKVLRSISTPRSRERWVFVRSSSPSSFAPFAASLYRLRFRSSTGDLSVHFREYLRDFFEPNVAALGYTIEHPDKVLLDLVLSDGEHRSFSKLLQQRFGVPVYQGDREKRQFDGVSVSSRLLSARRSDCADSLVYSGSTHRGVFSGNSDLELLAWLVKRYVAAKKWVGELQEATVMQWVTEKYLGSV